MSEQPMPTPGRARVFDALIADLRAREHKGIETYKTTLMTFNGRDPLQDLEEELLDALIYCRQLRMERDTLRAAAGIPLRGPHQEQPVG